MEELWSCIMIKFGKISLIIFITIIILILCLSVGVVKIDFLQTADILKNLILNKPENSILNDVIYYFRLPRFITALIVGSSLAVCGCVMQAVLCNPLAEPYILGISSGASLGAVIGILLDITQIFYFDSIGIFSFIGAVTVSLIIVVLNNIFYKNNTFSLLLSGIALNGVCSACVSLLITLYSDAEKIQNITFWLMGNLGNANWGNLKILSLIALISIVFFCSRFRVLNMMLFGDNIAVTLGKNLGKARQVYIIVIAILIGMIVYNVGMIGFVGLIVPHLCRQVVGSNHLYLVPFSAITGGIFLVFADLCSKLLLYEGEIPIGIIVSVIGSPVFLYMLYSPKYGVRA